MSHADQPFTPAEPTADATARRPRRWRMGAAGLAVAAILSTSACGAATSEASTSVSSVVSVAGSSTATADDTSSDTATTASDTTSAGGTSTASESTTSEATTDSSAEVLALAQAFADTLDEEQLAALYQDYSSENATNWSNFPQALMQNGMGGGMPGEPSSTDASDSSDATDAATSDATADSSSSGSSTGGRVGLQISELDEEQRAALEELLQAAMGSGDNEGYDEVMSILAADDYLAETDGGSEYGSDNYYIAFLGEPTDSGTWELQFGGHHLAVSNTYTDGELASATPSFRGTEPTGEFTVDGETYDPLSQETAAFSALAESLTEEQLAEAETDQTNLLLGPGEDDAFPAESEGVKVSDLSEEQQQLVLDAVETYVDDLPEDEAAEYMATYEAELDDTYVSFSGSTDFSEQGDYIRIDGPSVWIELAMQSGVATDSAHIHSVWRDKTSDYAGLTASE